MRTSRKPVLQAGAPAPSTRRDSAGGTEGRSVRGSGCPRLRQPDSAAPSYTDRASTAVKTASRATEVWSPILALTSLGSPSSARQSSTSGWIPMARSSRTLCWVGFVLYSPAVCTIGTRVRWRKQTRFGPVSRRNWRAASRKGWLSMSPTVPPISAMTHIRAPVRHRRQPALDLLGDMRDHLDRGPEILAPPFALDDGLVDLSAGHIRPGRKRGPGEPLVVADIEVGFRPVVGDEDLAVLVGAHGPRIHIEIRVELQESDRVALRLQQPADRRGGDPLAERGDHPAGDEEKARFFGDADGEAHETRPRPA